MDATLTIVVVSLVAGLAITCVLVGGAVAITRMATRHRERMARIGMGLDPDGQEFLPLLPPAAPSGLPSDDSSSANASSGGWDRFAATQPQEPRKATP